MKMFFQATGRLVLVAASSYGLAGCGGTNGEGSSLIHTSNTETYSVMGFKKIIVINERDNEPFAYDESVVYDRKGRITDFTRIEQDGSAYDTHTFTYNENDQVIKEVRRVHETNQIVECTYIYEKDTLLTQYACSVNGLPNDSLEYRYSEDGLLVRLDMRLDEGPEYCIYHYDSNRRLIEEIAYNWDGSVYERIGIEYNDEGEKTVEACQYVTRVDSTYYQDGQVVGLKMYNGGVLTQQFKYAYDDRGNLTKEMKQDGRSLKWTIITYSYIYDKHGNWTKRYKMRGDEPLLLTRRTIRYYD